MTCVTDPNVLQRGERIDAPQHKYKVFLAGLPESVVYAAPPCPSVPSKFFMHPDHILPPHKRTPAVSAAAVSNSSKARVSREGQQMGSLAAFSNLHIMAGGKEDPFAEARQGSQTQDEWLSAVARACPWSMARCRPSHHDHRNWDTWPSPFLLQTAPFQGEQRSGSSQQTGSPRPGRQDHSRPG